MREGQQEATRPKLGRPPTTPLNVQNDFQSDQTQEPEDDIIQEPAEQPEIQQRPVRSTRNVPHPKFNDYVWSASPQQLAVINSSISATRHSQTG